MSTDVIHPYQQEQQRKEAVVVFLYNCDVPMDQDELLSQIYQTQLITHVNWTLMVRCFFVGISCSLFKCSTLQNISLPNKELPASHPGQ